MNKKKKFLLSMLLGTFLFFCSSCSFSNDTSKDKKTIEMWTAYTEGQPTEKITKKFIKEFEKETGYVVNHTNFTYDMMHDKILASAAGRNVPDLVWGLPEFVGEFNSMNILDDITDEFDNWSEKKYFAQSVVDAMTVGDKVVGIPYEATVRAYLVHDKAFEDGSYQIPETWEDLLKMSDFKNESGKYPYSIAGKGVRCPQEMIVYFAQYGLEIAEDQGDGKFKNTWLESDDDTNKAIKVFEFYKQLVRKGIVSPHSANWGWEETDENFATGISSSYVTGNWLQEREKSNTKEMQDVSIQPIPRPEKGKNATYLEAKPLLVLKGAKNRKGAIELAKVLASKSYQSQAFQDRSPRNDVFTDTKWDTEYKKLMDNSISFPPVTLSNISQNMIDALAKALQEDMSSKEVVRWLSHEINQSLKENGEYGD
ncbi:MULTISPECIES: ABC transporter substrate-binding protein [Enterococcus]|uniref:Sugar ABC transporter substrate-binding protein n=1 Tax=Candidatus Enterococcus ferrettii TaxID=2815324 RepID=A0ABV0ET84_9ENTE|nr:extracellular solute-binding protein [Enterococcus sp. 665A]MBO1339840.1 extracellular solute-binding protein [Enterococcus sp. 665A]